MKKNKLGNIYLLDCEIDLNSMLGTVIYKIGKFGKTKKAEYVVMNNEIKITFLEPRSKGYELPEKKEDKENLLLMIYGKIGEMQYFMDLKKRFLKKAEEEKIEEQKAKELAKNFEQTIQCAKNISNNLEKVFTNTLLFDTIKIMKGEK